MTSWVSLRGWGCVLILGVLGCGPGGTGDKESLGSGSPVEVAAYQGKKSGEVVARLADHFPNPALG